ncbi:MAG: SpoIIIAH-like family protein [Eubacterium sp.]|jgi:stage III sporulation protein AH|nr:SpoIIIAH-like family protein [Eubacterium sp.]
MKKFKFKRPRFNFIISKKQIIIAGLTLVLGIAVYANYLLGASDLSNMGEPANLSPNEVENYGDARFVSGGSAEDISVELTDSEIYFAQARLDKKESRDESKELLKAMIDGGDNTETELQVIAQEAGKLSNYIECETKVETVLRAQGFEDALCYLSDRGANILIKSSAGDLAPEDAAKIKDALLSEIEVPAENITILEVK